MLWTSIMNNRRLKKCVDESPIELFGAVVMFKKCHNVIWKHKQWEIEYVKIFNHHYMTIYPILPSFNIIDIGIRPMSQAFP